MLTSFKGKNAVVTGAACGIGKGLSEKCLREGMNVLLADVDEDRLNAVVEGLGALGYDGNISSYVVDVSNEHQVNELSAYAYKKYDEVHLLFNNAGVSIGGKIKNLSLKDWNWVLGVNMWGVIYGVHAFLPKMQQQGTQCYIVNTASMSGFTCPPEIGIYNVSKHAVVALSETLFHELNTDGSNVGISVLSPDFVATEIMDSKRNRPSHLFNEVKTESSEADRKKWHEAVAEGMKPSVVADKTFEGIKNNQFYIFTHEDSLDSISSRNELIYQQKNPTNPSNVLWNGETK